jgi:hypothetical protein
MEHEASLPCSQKHAICPYPEPDKFVHTHPISLKFILILFSSLRLGLPSGLFPSTFLIETLHARLPNTWCMYLNNPFALISSF